MQRKRLLKNKSRLRHGTFSRVDKKDNTIYHLEYTLNLAAEVRMSRGVDDVYLDALIMHGCILCKYCNSAFAFKSVRVHYTLFRCLIFAVNTTLLEHFVNKGRLAVVNVCDYRNISQIFSFHFINLLRTNLHINKPLNSKQ